MAEKQEMLKYRDDLIKLSQEDHNEFMTYTKSLIDLYEKAGISVKPLLQSIKVELYTKYNLSIFLKTSITSVALIK